MGQKQPLAVDLYCGLGGWTEGLLALLRQATRSDDEATG
jgi:hypothetical protein